MTTRQSTTSTKRRAAPERLPVYPFTAIVGQEEMKLGLVLNVIDASIGGVLIMGHRGTGKSTAVRGLADLLPESWVVRGCAYRCDPADKRNACDSCRAKVADGAKLERERSRVPVVDLPLGATEDRVCGAIDMQRALGEGVKAFEPGLLARANRGFLYIDEVNLLEDHLVDLLLDVAVTGRNKVERESISVEHPACFVLIGSGNPEEGELRPQLLDRFGLHVEVKTEGDLDERVAIVERREAYERDPDAFCVGLEAEQAKLRQRITRAQKTSAAVKVDRLLLRKIAQLCSDLQIDGHRGELTITRAARALASFEGKKKVTAEEVKRVTPMALRHRLRRDPLEETASTERIQQALERTFPDVQRGRSGKSGDEGGEGGTGDGVRQQSDEQAIRPIGNRGRAASASGQRESGSRTELAPVQQDVASSMPQLPSNKQTRRKRNHSFSITSGSQPAAMKHTRNYVRGRYVRATANDRTGGRLAVDATLRAIANAGARTPDTLRFKELSHKSGRLFIFAIDTSGSMAWHRIGQAKGAMLNLLKQSYVRRDSVAIVGFRGNSGEVLLPASKSILRARRALESLRVGGGTPLSAGLACALKVAKSVRGTTGEITVLLFTDGRANVALNPKHATEPGARSVLIGRELALLGSEFAKAAVRLIVVDTQNGFVTSPEALAMAEKLGADYTRLPVQVSG